MLQKQIQEAAQKALSEPKYRHVVGVVDAACKLALHYDENPTRAEIAGWLHDLAREWSSDRLLQTAESIEIPSGFGSIPILLHGPVAAHIGRTTFDIGDEDLLRAVCYHTTGRMEMSRLEKIIFLADAIEEGRQYPGVDEIRAAAKTSLDCAMKLALDSTIRYLLDQGYPIFPLTVLARNAFLDNK